MKSIEVPVLKHRCLDIVINGHILYSVFRPSCCSHRTCQMQCSLQASVCSELCRRSKVSSLVVLAEVKSKLDPICRLVLAGTALTKPTHPSGQGTTSAAQRFPLPSYTVLTWFDSSGVWPRLWQVGLRSPHCSYCVSWLCEVMGNGQYKSPASIYCIHAPTLAAATLVRQRGC